MKEVEKILSPDFLIGLISIEKMKYFTENEKNKERCIFTSEIELTVTAIESTSREKILSENVYKLTLKNVSHCQVEIGEKDESSFHFDTDEVILTKVNFPTGQYHLKFVNAYTNVEITFFDVDLELLTKKEFIDRQ